MANARIGDSPWGFALGVAQILAILDNNMLVFPTQNSHIGGNAQRDGPTQMFSRCLMLNSSPPCSWLTQFIVESFDYDKCQVWLNHSEKNIKSCKIGRVHNRCLP